MVCTPVKIEVLQGAANALASVKKDLPWRGSYLWGYSLGWDALEVPAGLIAAWYLMVQQHKETSAIKFTDNTYACRVHMSVNAANQANNMECLVTTMLSKPVYIPDGYVYLNVFSANCSNPHTFIALLYLEPAQRSKAGPKFLND